MLGKRSRGIFQSLHDDFPCPVARVIWRRFIWRQHSPTFGFAVVFLIFVVLTATLYVLWMWVFFEHPAEIAEKLPISSIELRKKKKNFFDTLPK